ncbi:MAG TPA: translation elongation factor Ts [Longimicrobiales bacterium]|nr:translation elongation factor Ts [Longimicrobiales bacterium]
MAISAQQVKELRERTGAGMMECKKALEEANGNMEAAIDLLRARGAAKAAKRAERETREGTIGSYVHTNGKIGVLVEVQCETDFVSRNETFQQLARDLAMHIAAAAPLALDAEGIPADVVERERGVYLEQVKQEGKPEKMQEKIVEGKLRKFYQESTLMDQIFVKDPAGKQTIQQLIEEASAKTGERVVVRRFVRYQLGE